MEIDNSMKKAGVDRRQKDIFHHRIYQTIYE